MYVHHVSLFVFALGEVAPDNDHRLNPGPPPREALELLPQLGSSSTGRSSKMMESTGAQAILARDSPLAEALRVEQEDPRGSD